MIFHHCSDLRRIMSAQVASNGRTPRVRSCRKRSYIGDDDSSPEIRDSTSKKSKPPTAKTPLKKTAKTSNATNPVETPLGRKNGLKTPKKVDTKRTRKSVEEEHSVLVVEDSPIVVTNGHQSSARTEEVVTGIDDCTFEQKDTWPLKYSPSIFGNFVGNRSAVERVERWLTEWKVATKKSALRDSGSSASDSLQGEASSSALFIKGPPGVGKTSLVYYLAKRSGFTVLEVNSSSERPGKRVLADLQEATQSQHVKGTKVAEGGINSFFKPTLTPCANPQTPVAQSGSSKNRKKLKNAVTVKEKRGTLKSFFNSVTPKSGIEEVPTQSIAVEEPAVEEKISRSSIKAFFAAEKKSSAKCASESPEILTTYRQSSAANAADGSIKCSSSTIILFDDVDVIFDDDGDEGFWMALETVLKSSKIPCILTATRGYEGVVKRCKSLQNALLVELHRPSPSHVASLISNICAVENRDLTDYNVEFMCQYLASDVRRSLIQMEFETVSSGLLQTVYPANKTIGGLVTSGSTEDALEIHIAFKKVGFNALYASLEDCLPFEFDDVMLDTSNGATLPDKTLKRPTEFVSATVKDFARIFDEFSTNDLFLGCLKRMGEECLPSYERAKRWMKQHPVDNQETSQRVVEDLLELSSVVLLGKTSVSLNRISERFAALDVNEQSEHRLCRVANSLGFRDIHKQLKKVRMSENCLDDVLQHFPIRHSTGLTYLDYLKAMCCAENEKREKSRRGNRLSHYLSNIGVYFSPEQLTRISAFWS
ncbi:uncharacterized protein LOC100901223 [Galendromus occidentalis]|uniref:Uncharacterized protein LOC100901223 n=1 Tax=Galendromus occidentalis TaxID=34638 RepID=A0AAJ7PAH1_9ACAR|nr:uncharacterized protein LOC100901223 [Galendromus occidentalis]